MANLVVTSTANSIKVDFGNSSFVDNISSLPFSKGTWSKNEISSIRLNASYVVVKTKDETEWLVADKATEGAFTIDTVDAAAPSNLSDLYDKLIALIA